MSTLVADIISDDRLKHINEVSSKLNGPHCKHRGMAKSAALRLEWVFDPHFASASLGFIHSRSPNLTA